MKKFHLSPIIASVLFASVAISGSLLFLAIQLGGAGSVDIDAAIERYVVRQRADQGKTQVDQRKVAAEKAKNVRPVDDSDHIRGDSNALISLIEYSDFECPYCKRFHPTATEFIKKNKGKVNWVYRHFPLSFHDPLATQEAIASECAAELGGDDKFWEYTDLIFERTNSNGKGLNSDELPSMAAEIGLNRTRFQACLDSSKYDERVKNDIAEGVSYGVTGTPGNILRNNETGEVRFIPGAYPLAALESALSELTQ